MYSPGQPSLLYGLKGLAYMELRVQGPNRDLHSGSFGGGVEWAGPSLGVRNFPIRLGMRNSDLPFTFDGENPTEKVLSAGIGLNLLPAQAGLMGAIDLAFEKGTREAGSLSESFWRATVTFRVGSF